MGHFLLRLIQGLDGHAREHIDRATRRHVAVWKVDFIEMRRTRIPSPLGGEAVQMPTPDT
jgi:hypothetical protein